MMRQKPFSTQKSIPHAVLSPTLVTPSCELSSGSMWAWVGRWGAVLGFLFIFEAAVTTTSSAQDSPTTTASEEKPTNGTSVSENSALESAKKAMREHLKKIGKTITLFRLNEDENVDAELQKEYQQLLIDGRPIALELQRQLILDARKTIGDEKTEKTNFIYDLFMENSDFDRYEHNWELAQYLIEVGFEDKKREIYAVLGRNALALNDFETARKFYEKAVAIQVFPEVEQKTGVVLMDAAKKWPAEEAARKQDAEKGDLPRVEFETTKGKFVIELFEDEAPNTVGNFIHLVEKGFYNNLLFHRVEKHLVVQTGCPNQDGTGGPGYSILGENGRPNSRNHFRGSVGMALAGDDADSGGSQFYICLVPVNFLDGRFTVFGRIVEGMDTVENINRVNLSEKEEEGEPKLVPEQVLNAKVLRKRSHEYVPQYSKPPKGEGE
jgi:cyclophilin family peptidyl-prolyl cis-trans isomerase